MMNIIADIWKPTGHDLHLFSPELALIGTIVAVLIVPLLGGRRAHAVAAAALAGSLVTLMMIRGVAKSVSGGGHGGLSPLASQPMLLVDNFGVFFKMFLMLFFALVVWLWLVGASEDREPRQGAPEFFVLLLVSALGMSLMVSTLNLLVIVIAIEMASQPSYAIVASNKRSRLGAEASLKYVLFGAATSSIMVYGVSLLYGVFGTLDVSAIALKMSHDPASGGLLAGVGLFAFCVGIAFKISAVPFHFWCPDVFEGAPIEVTTWLSVASKAAGLGLLLRIVHALSAVENSMVPLAPIAVAIGLIASLTCTVGNLAAMRQDSVKRILAYSSIAHAGYMMMAAAIFAQPTSGQAFNLGVAAVIAYLFVYLLMNLGAFSVTAMVVWRTGSDKLSAFTGLGRRSPWLALPMAACLFSLVGLPPLGGFAAKWYLIYYLGQAATVHSWLWGLVIVAVINTAISLYFYVRIIRTMYLEDDAAQPAIRAPFGGVVMANACAVMLVLLGTVFLNPLGEKAKSYASSLFPAPPAESRAIRAAADPQPASLSLNSDRRAAR